MSVHAFDHQPRLSRFSGETGVAWLVTCASTRECAVIDAHHAPDEIATAIREGGLTLAASLATGEHPSPDQNQRRYHDLLAVLGLVPPPAPEARVTAGLVRGWEGATVLGFGSRFVELDEQADDSLVLRADGTLSEPLRAVATSLVIRFGRHSAIGRTSPAAPKGSIVWRIGCHLFVAEREGAAPSDVVVHETCASEEEETPVGWVDADGFDFTWNPQIVDVEPAGSDVPLIPGAVRRERGTQLEDLDLDVWRPVLCVSAHGDACAETAVALAELGYTVLRLRGGIREWIRHGRPVVPAPSPDREDLSIEAGFELVQP